MPAAFFVCTVAVNSALVLLGDSRQERVVLGCVVHLLLSLTCISIARAAIRTSSILGSYGAPTSRPRQNHPPLLYNFMSNVGILPPPFVINLSRYRHHDALTIFNGCNSMWMYAATVLLSYLVLFGCLFAQWYKEHTNA